MGDNGNKGLQGRTLYIHPMTRSGALLLAATFRSIDIDARVVPPSDTRTLDLGRLSVGLGSGRVCAGKGCISDARLERTVQIRPVSSFAAQCSE